MTSVFLRRVPLRRPKVRRRYIAVVLDGETLINLTCAEYEIRQEGEPLVVEWGRETVVKPGPLTITIRAHDPKPVKEPAVE